MDKCGIIYVASQGIRFLCEAIGSAESVKRTLPAIPMTLFTDIPALKGAFVDPFEKIVSIDLSLIKSEAKGLSWGLGLYAKVSSLTLSPYEKTLFLDSDTRVLSEDLSQLFDLLQDYSIAMVPCVESNSESCRLLGPMFNTGMIAYRKEAGVDLLLAEWKKLQYQHLELACQEPPGAPSFLSHLGHEDRRFMLFNDQTSLATLLSPVRNDFDLKIKLLENRWNARNFPRAQLEGVVVDHANCHKIKLENIKGFLKARGLVE